jgi:hypothetical protein
MESLMRRGWCYISVRAEAEIGLPQAGENYLTERITSAGTRGIESDSEPGYLMRVEQNGLDNLKDALRQLGFGTRAVSKDSRTSNGRSPRSREPRSRLNSALGLLSPRPLRTTLDLVGLNLLSRVAAELPADVHIHIRIALRNQSHARVIDGRDCWLRHVFTSFMREKSVNRLR